MKDQFVPYEMAQKMKALGFVDTCIGWWYNPQNNEPDLETDNLFTKLFNQTKEKWAKHDFVCGYDAGYKQALIDNGII
jgi:hypothetical protein